MALLSHLHGGVSPGTPFINAYGVWCLTWLTNGLVGVINIGTLFILIALLVKAHPKDLPLMSSKNSPMKPDGAPMD